MMYIDRSSSSRNRRGLCLAVYLSAVLIVAVVVISIIITGNEILLIPEVHGLVVHPKRKATTNVLAPVLDYSYRGIASAATRHGSYHGWMIQQQQQNPAQLLRLFSSGTDETEIKEGTEPTIIQNQFDEIRNDYNGNDADDESIITMTPATVNTVNERLLAELKEAAELEKSGRSKSNNNRLNEVTSYFKSSKTDAERKAAIAEAQNLNGVNPISTLFGAFFALLCSVGLWIGTQSIVTYFALHPPDSDIYFVERVTLVSRNVVMGLAALASGFFGVTGIGILLLAIRVGYGILTGELDPTPIVPTSNQLNNNINDKNTVQKVDISNVWDFMTNKPPKKGPS